MASLQSLVLQQAPRDVVRFHTPVCALTKAQVGMVIQRGAASLSRLRTLCATSSRAFLESFELVFVPVASAAVTASLTLAFAPEASEVGSLEDFFSLAGCHFPPLERAGSAVPFTLTDDFDGLGISRLIKPVPLELGRLCVYLHLTAFGEVFDDLDDAAVLVRVFARGRVRLSGFSD